MDRMKQQIAFLMEIDKVKNIFRQTYLADGKRKENDAEHSWHLAIAAFLLIEDAGDTYAYDAEGAKTKRAREVAAADRIFGMLPEDQGGYFRELWDEFEAYESDDAKFAHLLDNFQPLLLNHEINGKSWTEHHVKKSQIYKRNEKIKETSPEVWEWMKQIVEEHIALGHVIDE